jgi:uncharacterized OB-fold protein
LVRIPHQLGEIMAADHKSKPIDSNLFVWPSDNPALLGSHCGNCGRVAFPVGPSCTRCGGTSVDIVELPRRGRLWTWTIQRFMPKSPYNSSETDATFKPFGIGYVELPGAIRIEARLTENDPAKLQFGAEMELAIYIHRFDADGTRIMNYAFKPSSTAT